MSDTDNGVEGTPVPSSLNESQTDPDVTFSNKQLLSRIKELEKAQLDLEAHNKQQRQDLLDAECKLAEHKNTEVVEGMKEFFHDYKANKTNNANPAKDPGKENVVPDKNTQQVSPEYESLVPKVKTDSVCDPIAPQLCQMLARCWLHPFTNEEITEVIDSAKRPSNCPMLKPLEINEQVFSKMSPEDHKREKDVRYIGNAICAAGKNLAQLMHMLSTAKIQCKQEDPDSGGILELDGFEFNFPKANNLMCNAMKLLGIANVQGGQHRRELLKDKFKGNYAKLCHKNSPFEGGMFFGENFDAATSMITGENKVLNTALRSSNTTNFNNRGKTRGFKWKRQRTMPYTKQLQQQNAYLRKLVAHQAPTAPFLGAAPAPQFQQWSPQPVPAPTPLFPPPQFNNKSHFKRGRGHGSGGQGRGRGRR